MIGDLDAVAAMFAQPRRCSPGFQPPCRPTLISTSFPIQPMMALSLRSNHIVSYTQVSTYTPPTCRLLPPPFARLQRKPERASLRDACGQTQTGPMINICIRRAPPTVAPPSCSLHCRRNHLPPLDRRGWVYIPFFCLKCGRGSLFTNPFPSLLHFYQIFFYQTLNVLKSSQS